MGIRGWRKLCKEREVLRRQKPTVGCNAEEEEEEDDEEEEELSNKSDQLVKLNKKKRQLTVHDTLVLRTAQREPHVSSTFHLQL
jgi:hypothetical protein